ncbi:MAG TPA: SulP family inorganic anion transporter [Gemmataceae bacterium]|nr:SulP family inorganic anion transporter [Gemmataceae bacterium]
METDNKEAPESKEVPVGNLQGLAKYWRYDLLSGFLVFLIALPLCLAIASASGYPPIAGIFTAIIGGILSAFISNSELTIKGPAAGLIVIAIGCVNDFGGGTPTHEAYRMALAVGAAAGVLQILFAVFRSGILGEFFPTSVVHGMLAAIGVIIIAKNAPVALGVDNAGSPLQLLRDIFVPWNFETGHFAWPAKFANMNPEIALIGGISVLLLFGLPFIKNRYVKMVPAAMIVLLVSVAMGIYFDLADEHTYTFGEHVYQVDDHFLVNVPDNMFAAITTPDFTCLYKPELAGRAWYWVIMFALIGSLESLLSAKAIDNIDPWHRKSNMDRDLLAIAIGNTIAAFVGGLPMIAEIVRSKANIDNGARTRFANMFHGLFLLGFVATVPFLIHRIPNAALGAMLIYTGFRLASPREFFNVFKIGREQLIIFVVTIVAVLATDLLKGIAIGIVVKFAIHLYNILPVLAFVKATVVVERPDEKTELIRVYHFAIFSNWIFLRRAILAAAPSHDVIVDLSETRLVDHTTMEKLHEIEKDFHEQGRKFIVIGMDEHVPVSSHPYAARTKAVRIPDAKPSTTPPQSHGANGVPAEETSVMAK